MKKTIIIAVLAYLFILAADGRADDFAQLTRNYKDYCLGRASSSSRRTVSEREALKVARALQPDGSWKDVNYTDDTRGGWLPYTHLGRVYAMVRAYRNPQSGMAGNAELKQAIHKALVHWLRKDYQCPNWWYNVIGVPMVIGQIGILMQDELTKEEFEIAVNRILPRAKIGMTGQNRVWVAGNTLVRGLLLKDHKIVQEASAVLGEEIRVTTSEGVQPDFSFHQHGPQQQFGNYGLSFASSSAMWLQVFGGTPFAFPKEKLDIVHDYLVEGESWVVWKGRMDLSSCGRQLDDGTQAGKGRGVASAMSVMARVDKARAGEYEAFLKRNAPGGVNELIGNRHFWRSDYMIQREKDYYASVKMASRRVIGGEEVNSENVSGYHLADGALLLMRSGEEYEDIQPLWDWRKIPGTTCAQLPDGPPRLRKRYTLDSDFAGGVSDGRNGCAALDYARDGVKARKAWFFANGMIVCLGNGITAEVGHPVVTTVEQCWLKGDVIAGTGAESRKLPKGEHKLDGIDWVWHNGVGYVFFKPEGLTVRNDAQRGSWRKVEEKPSVSGRELSGDVFLLTLDHGTRPQDAKYAYVVLPGISAEAMKGQSARKLLGEMLVNEIDIQAVRTAGSKITQVVFHKGMMGGGNVSLVDQPCLVTVDESGPAPRLAVADPTQQLKTITVEWNGKMHELTLPQGGEAGKSVVIQGK